MRVGNSKNKKHQILQTSEWVWRKGTFYPLSGVLLPLSLLFYLLCSFFRTPIAWTEVLYWNFFFFSFLFYDAIIFFFVCTSFLFFSFSLLSFYLKSMVNACVFRTTTKSEKFFSTNRIILIPFAKSLLVQKTSNKKCFSNNTLKIRSHLIFLNIQIWTSNITKKVLSLFL